MHAGERTLYRAIGIHGFGVEHEISHVLGSRASSNPGVARINSAGVITALASGNATLRFRVPSGIEGSLNITIR